MHVAPTHLNNRDRVRGWRSFVRACVLALALASTGCGVPAARPAPGHAAHRVWIVHHGHHSGIVVRAAEVPPQAWPAKRDFPHAEFLEIGWGDRAYYMAPAPGLWIGLRALLSPTPAVLHVAAFHGPPERTFGAAGIVEVTLTAPGFTALVTAVRESHERAPVADGQDRPQDWLPPLGHGLYGASRFYASHERFHLFKTCNVWTAGVLAAAGVPLRPAAALTADALFAQLRPYGRVLREPP